MASSKSINAAATRRMAMKKGLSFSLMVVGASGLGKSTFINTLCEMPVIGETQHIAPGKAGLPKTLSIKAQNVELEQDGVKLSLTIVDTPGFGDNINNRQGFQDILEYIEAQFDDVIGEETRIRRNPRFQDRRVHALLYFIQPTGIGLKEIDIEFMKILAPRVNVIPVIAKSDSLSPAELCAFKARIMEDIRSHSIPIFDFPSNEEEDDEELVEENRELLGLLPFAVIGSDTELVVNGRRVRCRQYPWGVVEVDNVKHCDFAKLRYMLLTSHLLDLKEITHDFMYERYRTEKLSKKGEIDPIDAEEVSQNVTSPSLNPQSKHASSASGMYLVSE